MGTSEPEEAWMERTQAEGHWADHEATEEQLRQYLGELHRELTQLGALTPDEVTADEAERQADASAHGRLRYRVGVLYELLGAAYLARSGKSNHSSDCRISVSPAFRPGPCNCDAPR